VWVNQLTLSINGKRRNITTADFMTIAIANNIKKAEQLIEEIKSTVRDWEKYAEKANVRPDLAQLIKTNLNV
jgi:hypothetical protein